MDMKSSVFWLTILSIVVLTFIILSILSVHKIRRYRQTVFYHEIQSLESFLDILDNSDNHIDGTLRTKISKEILKIVRKKPQLLTMVPSNDKSKVSENLETQLLPNQFLKPYPFNILLALSNLGKTYFTTLLKTLKMSKGNLNHHLKKLQEQDLVKEENDLMDFRRKTWEITPQGKQEFNTLVHNLKNRLQKFEPPSSLLVNEQGRVKSYSIIQTAN
ncbi:hypothetical protein NEF87_003488 [Candidatus Lokiarchaeum ossiferum]|uniref:Winged helix DNA-binding domain-containing protein n=1 Tax=Candidatus Lokiarchaeum ossiferum TaxID=2951803 RepID=A0ABY6HUK1_9ARCH|nr:hypothetical protein NEF87_003488 [Candidatus Lokiarchaeum sp. B-35]